MANFLPSAILLLSLWSCFVQRAFGALSNVTIDDTYGDEATGALPTYAGSCRQGSTCGSNCRAHPDLTDVYRGDYHDCGSGSVAFQFTGHALYIYFIRVEGWVVDIATTIDGQLAGSYQLQATGDDNNLVYFYNTSLFATDNLQNGTHTVNISTPDVLLFDYAQYTVGAETSPSGQSSAPAASSTSTGASSTKSPSSSKNNGSARRKTPIGAIVGAIIGGIIVLIIAILALLSCYRRKRASESGSAGPIPRRNGAGLLEDAEGPPMRAQEMLTRGPDGLTLSYTPFELPTEPQASSSRVALEPTRRSTGASSTRKLTVDPPTPPPVPTDTRPRQAASTDRERERPPLPSVPTEQEIVQQIERLQTQRAAIVHAREAEAKVPRPETEDGHSDERDQGMRAQIADLQAQVAELSAQLRDHAYEPPPGYE